MRKGFNFYRSYYDVWEELTDKDKIAFMDALLKKQFFDVDPTDLKGQAKFAYVSQRHSIDAQVKGFKDKTGNELAPPTEPPSQGAYHPPSGQEKGEEKEKAQVQEKEEGKDIESRKTDFYNSLQGFMSQYSETTISDFFNYWTEPNKKGNLRFEDQKYFDVGRRLSTWSRNENKFNNGKNTDGTRKSKLDVVFEASRTYIPPQDE